MTTINELLTREAACRTAANYVPGKPEDAAAKMAAAQVLLSMAAYRVLPLLSWPGGPYHGQAVSEEDRRYALFNLAGVLQACLRLRLEIRRSASVIPMTVQGDDVPLGDVYKRYLSNGGPRDYTAGTFAERFTDLSGRLPSFPAFSAPTLFIAFVRPMLKALGYTAEDLAAAYFEATAGLVPPVNAPEGHGLVYHPGSGQEAPTPEDVHPPTLQCCACGEPVEPEDLGLCSNCESEASAESDARLAGVGRTCRYCGEPSNWRDDGICPECEAKASADYEAGRGALN